MCECSSALSRFTARSWLVVRGPRPCVAAFRINRNCSRCSCAFRRRARRPNAIPMANRTLSRERGVPRRTPSSSAIGARSGTRDAAQSRRYAPFSSPATRQWRFRARVRFIPCSSICSRAFFKMAFGAMRTPPCDDDRERTWPGAVWHVLRPATHHQLAPQSRSGPAANAAATPFITIGSLVRASNRSATSTRNRPKRARRRCCLAPWCA